MKSSGAKPAARHPLKPVEFLVLAVLQSDLLHGYGIVQQIHQRSEGRVKMRPGDLYRILYRLSQRGLIETAEPDHPSSHDERRNYYRITMLGQEILREEASFLGQVAKQVLAAGRAGR